jgi:hypothetical protein
MEIWEFLDQLSDYFLRRNLARKAVLTENTALITTIFSAVSGYGI